MINWFTYGGPMDISHEVASIMTSMLAVLGLFVGFGLLTWCVVKMYTTSWKITKKEFHLDETHHESLMNQVRKQQRGDKQ